MMTPRRFRWHRVGAVLKYDPTGTVEIVVGFCLVVIPGLLLATNRSVLPDAPLWYLSHIGFTDRGVGVLMIVFGLAQVWGGGTNWYAARAWIALGLSFSLTVVVTAYRASGYGFRWAVGLLVGLIIAQMYIAWRCWHERPDSPPARKEPSRGDHPVS